MKFPTIISNFETRTAVCCQSCQRERHTISFLSTIQHHTYKFCFYALLLLCVCLVTVIIYIYIYIQVLFFARHTKSYKLCLCPPLCVCVLLCVLFFSLSLSFFVDHTTPHTNFVFMLCCCCVCLVTVIILYYLIKHNF